MVTFIDDHGNAYGVEPICRVLPIAPSTDCAWKVRRADPARRPARAQRDDRLKPEIARVWQATRRRYGAKQVEATEPRSHRGRALRRGTPDG